MSQPFDSQYRCLADLKEIDEKAHWVERDVERVPTEIGQLETALSDRRRDLDQAKAQAQACEKNLRAAERELKEKEDSLFKAEGKMMEVKTNVEYQAALKENEVQKQAKAILEDRVLGLLNEMEEQKGLLKAIEQEFRTYEQGILEKKKQLTDEHQQLIKQLEEILRKRQAVADQLDPTTSQLYKRIVATAKSGAIAVADQGRCQGCNIQIRPQIYNEVLGHKAIHRCGNCGRILIVSGAAAAQGSEEQLGAK